MPEKNKFLENPYPEDIFPEITKEEWKKIDELLKRELGFPLDRVAGNINRKMWNNMRERFLEMARELLEEIENIRSKALKESEDVDFSNGVILMCERTRTLIKKWFPDIEP